MKSYESCNWIIKQWRKRWYIYAIFLHLKNLLKVYLLIEYILSGEIEKNSRKKLRTEWKYILRHVELNKMCKLTTSKNKDISLREE